MRGFHRRTLSFLSPIVLPWLGWAASPRPPMAIGWQLVERVAAGGQEVAIPMPGGVFVLPGTADIEVVP